MDIYVGNLSYDVTEDELRQLFESYGEIHSIKIIKDRYTGRSKGFGFIEMPVEDDANTAISNVNGTSLNGRELKVNKAQPRRSF